MRKASFSFKNLKLPKRGIGYERQKTAFLEKVTGESDKISLGLTRVKDGKRYSFSASFDGELARGQKILLCHGKMASYGNWIEITPTELKKCAYVPWVEPPLRENAFAHGLTVKNLVELNCNL